MVTAERYDIDAESINDGEIILSATYVAGILGVSHQAIHSRLKNGTIPFVDVPHLGRRVYAPKFREWCELQRDLILVQDRLAKASKDLLAEERFINKDIEELVERDWTVDMIERFPAIN